MNGAVVGRKLRVAVAMSGGVDSAVAALLTAEAGHDVVGVTMKLWCYGETPATERSCCSLSAIEDARASCDRIGIRHFVMNFEHQFRSNVIDRFVGVYLAGATPNPCVLCNTHVKFGALLEQARALGMGAVATGHYARLSRENGGLRLLRGRDAEKDQSYALWGVPAEVLAHTLLPIGSYTKPEVRELARRAGLPVADKRESQDICFVPDGDYGGFVAREGGRAVPALMPGEIQDESGRTVGRHDGVARYTIGQRRGLGISHPVPLYVIGLDAERNVLTVGPRSALAMRAFEASELNWISIAGLTGPRRVVVKIRYAHRGSSATVTPVSRDRVRVELDEPEDAVTPGQSAVFYDGDVVLGGGVIEKSIGSCGPMLESSPQLRRRDGLTGRRDGRAV